MKRLRKDNQGIALVTVLVVMLLCFLLSATIMRASYVALLSRNVNSQSIDTFYDAESVVDDIKMKLQTVAAISLEAAGAEDSEAFIEKAYTTLTNNASTAADAKKNAEEYLNKSVFDVAALNAGAMIEILPDGEIIKAKDEKNNSILKITKVHIVYVDPKTEYRSEIVTDIRINAPFYASSVKTSLGSYSTLVGSGAEMCSEESFQNKKPGYMVQEGNVYFGTFADSSLALKLRNYVTLDCNGDNVVINGDIYVTGNSTLKFTSGGAVEVRGSIYLMDHSHLVIASDTYLLCKDIVIDDKSVSGNVKGQKNPVTNTTVGGPYLNAATGTVYSPYIPYDHDPVKDFKESMDTTYVQSNQAPVSSILILDKTDNKCYGLVTSDNGSTFKYKNSAGMDKEFELVSGTTNVSDNKGIYFDKAIVATPKIPFTQKKTGSTTTYAVDDQIHKFLNVAYLTYIAKDSNARQIRRMCNDYREVTGVTNELEDQKTVGKNNFYYEPVGSLVNSVDIPLKYQGVTYTGSIQNDDGVVFGVSQSAYNPNKSTFLSLFFCCNTYTVEFNNGTNYLGVFMSMDRVLYKVKWGNVVGRSILSSSDSKDIDAVKEYIEKLSYYVVGQDAPQAGQESYWLVNNMFNNGWKSFFENENETTTTIDSNVNKDLNLVELENWNKQ